MACTEPDGSACGATQTPPMDAAFFESLYAHSRDPWRFDGSWYEARKRGLLLASLPSPRYASAFEPGCATGHLTAELARRCDALHACDASASAADATRQRLESQPHVTVSQAWLPAGWPASRTFDLIVLSEFLYYLPQDEQSAIARASRASLRPGGTVVACHWRHPIEGCASDGDAVHKLLGRKLALSHTVAVRDADFCLDVWSDGPSAAAHEGRA